LLNAEAIASSMLCAVIFAAGLAGVAGIVGVTLALLAFHYYLVPPGSSYLEARPFAVDVPEIPRLILFSHQSLVVAF